MRTKVLVLMFLLGFIIEYPIYSQEHNGRTYTIKGAYNLVEFIEMLKEKTDCKIAYKESDVKKGKKISIDYKNTPIDVILKNVLKKYGLTFIQQGDRIIIKQEYIHSEGGIRGAVKNKLSLKPLEYVNVILLDANNNQIDGTSTDSCGTFKFPNLKVGRYLIKASMLGYTSVLSDYIIVTSTKTSNLELFLEENSENIDEVTIIASTPRNYPQNIMSLTGGRILSIEETNRFAGNFDDPTRLASSFAGITSGSVNSNAMEIRGNSPQFAQWRMEGIETPNLSHYADMSGLGGGILTGLSLQTMANSDFYYGAYPAEYSNSLSGIFNMKMRNGNTTDFAHAVQLGIWGFDLSSEGPINKKSGSSYLFNYRYSYSGLADKISGSDEGLNYQDLAFKINLPTKKLGTFTFWGIGLLDKIIQRPEDDPKQWETSMERQEQKADFQKGAIGMAHTLSWNDNTYLRSNIGITFSGTKAENHIYDNELNRIPVAFATKHETNLQINTFINKRFNAFHTNRTGISYTGIFYDLNFNISPNIGLFYPMECYAYGEGQNNVLYIYSNSLFQLTNKLKMNVGVGTQYIDLNKAWTIEPRLSFKWNFHPKQYLSFGYGLSGRRERIEYYYTYVPNQKDIDNTRLGMGKTHQLNLTYDWMITNNLNLRIEPYFQYLYNIPVQENSSFSIINFNAFILDKQLASTGKGKNYGIDISLEHYLKKGWYWMVNGSLFKSKYMGGDNIWRNSRMDRGFVVKALAGKEWTLGKKGNKILGVNVKLTYQGGERYSPIDYIESEKNHLIEVDETKAYSLQLPPSFISDLSINYRINKEKVSHEFSFQLLNLNGFKNTYYQYNILTNQVEKKHSASLVPNIRYKLFF